MSRCDSDCIASRVGDLERRLSELEEDRRHRVLEDRLGRVMLDPSVLTDPDPESWAAVRNALNSASDYVTAPFYVASEFGSYVTRDAASLGEDPDRHAFLAVFANRGADADFETLRGRFESLYGGPVPVSGPFDEIESEWSGRGVPDDLREMQVYAEENPGEVFGVSQETLDEFWGWEEVARCLVQQLQFMRETGSLAARTRATFDGLMNVGNRVVSVGKRGFDSLVGKTVKKRGRMSNADRARAVGKWLGIAAPELLPLAGISISGGSKLALTFILAFDPDRGSPHGVTT